jgi:hypothetical protein
MAKTTFDASDCPGVGSTPVKFDATRFAIMGHSMGATIAPLAIAYEPMYRAAILSGAGASFIQNIMYKEHPLNVRPAIELLLGYVSQQRHLVASDPVLTLFQWAEEPADPLVYNARILREPPAGAPARHVLMEQGIVDHYIMPPIADAMSLSLGLDLAGTPLDATTPEVATLEPIESVLPYSGHRQITFPASANFAAPDGTHVTAIVVQHPSDGIEDGHEIVFQTEPPKNEYRCFLQSFARGTPSVPQGASPDAPCP